MTKKTPLLRQFGFDARRRRALLQLIGLDATDHARAVYLQKHVIGPHVDEIVEEFYKFLWKNPQAKKILEQGVDVVHLRVTQRAYLQTLGVGFDRTDYFEGRLRVGATHARVAVPLSLYQATYSLLQRLILAHVPTRTTKELQNYRALAVYLSKIAALDMSLAIETYHGLRLGALQKSISALRGETLALHRRVDTDSSTGLVNHGRILKLLEQELVKIAERPVSVIIADVDRFKSINDTHGHVVGDKVLQGITARLRSAARRGDVIGRYGGDEFLIVLKNTESKTALRVAERMRSRLKDQPFDFAGHSIQVTLSAGVATARIDDNSESLIESADAALYRAKRAGRDRVLLAMLVGSVSEQDSTTDPSPSRPPP